MTYHPEYDDLAPTLSTDTNVVRIVSRGYPGNTTYYAVTVDMPGWDNFYVDRDGWLIRDGSTVEIEADSLEAAKQIYRDLGFIVHD